MKHSLLTLPLALMSALLAVGPQEALQRRLEKKLAQRVKDLNRHFPGCISFRYNRSWPAPYMAFIDAYGVDPLNPAGGYYEEYMCWVDETLLVYYPQLRWLFYISPYSRQPSAASFYRYPETIALIFTQRAAASTLDLLRKHPSCRTLALPLS